MAANSEYKVRFTPDANQLYGFDQPGDKTPASNYNTLHPGGETVMLLWKSVELGH